MPDEPTPPNPGQRRELNLQQMASQFMAGVQRHFDMLAFNLASRENTSEAAYNAHVRSAGIMPVPQLHQNFEQMQAHARDLLMRQVLNDTLNLTVTCLNNTHLFLALLKQKKESDANQLDPQRQQAAQQAQQAFVKAPLERKFDRLEKDYGIMCELEDSITSIAFCMQALMAQGGRIRAQQLDDQQQLVLELVTAAGSLQKVPNLQPANVQMARKVFHLDDRVTFSDAELLSLPLTVGLFAQQLFLAVSKYAQPA
jgi:hypothetical protein